MDKLRGKSGHTEVSCDHGSEGEGSPARGSEAVKAPQRALCVGLPALPPAPLLLWVVPSGRHLQVSRGWGWQGVSRVAELSGAERCAFPGKALGSSLYPLRALHSR